MLKLAAEEPVMLDIRLPMALRDAQAAPSHHFVPATTSWCFGAFNALHLHLFVQEYFQWEQHFFVQIELDLITSHKARHVSMTEFWATPNRNGLPGYSSILNELDFSVPGVYRVRAQLRHPAFGDPIRTAESHLLVAVDGATLMPRHIQAAGAAATDNLKLRMALPTLRSADDIRQAHCLFAQFDHPQAPMGRMEEHTNQELTIDDGRKQFFFHPSVIQQTENLRVQRYQVTDRFDIPVPPGPLDGLYETWSFEFTYITLLVACLY